MDALGDGRLGEGRHEDAHIQDRVMVELHSDCCIQCNHVDVHGAGRMESMQSTATHLGPGQRRTVSVLYMVPGYYHL
ncbi:MAG: hypothetical protein ACKPKO_58740, partial [Candidatus Fonsibacter sp.]